MSIALTNRVKALERQLADAHTRIEQLEAAVKALQPRPVGRPPKATPEAEKAHG